MTFAVQKIKKNTPFTSCGVEISGISPTISRDHLMVFFESPRMSGGDECEDFFFDPENNKAVVTYKNTKGMNLVKD